MEYWDLYNEKRELLGKTKERHEVFLEGEYYVCVEIWLMNFRGELLTTQRHPDKKRGGMWEFTGGGVVAGETTKQAAFREMKEELGLIIEEEEINLFTTYKHKNYFMDIYLVKKNISIDELVLQEDEVSSAKFVTKEEFQNMCNQGIVVYGVKKRYETYCNQLS